VYNYSQQVYWASELTAGGASGPSYISKIRFNPGATIQPSTNWQNWQLFLGNTTADGFATTSSWITGLTQVFSGTIATPVANTWLEFTLPTPFYWDGTSNLVVGTYENSPGYYCTQNWLSYSATAPVSGTRGILFYSDPTDPFSTPSLPTANVSQNTLAQIQFEMTPAVACSGTPNAGTAVAPALMQCPNTAFPLSLSGSTAASGLTVQWQESLGGGIWSDITGATTKNYTVLSGASATTYYRAILTCTNSSLADTSTEDTVTVAPLFPGGTYTINSALPTGGTNYQTFTDAVAAMQCGIAGPVVFNVSAGTYNEKITLPATINATSTNTVTFNGNGATLVDSNAAGGTNYATLRLDGADYITFKNLNIKANGLTYGFAVHLSNGADWNTFDSCTMSAKIASTSSLTGGVIMSGSPISATTAGANGSNNVFSNSTISGGYYATSIYGDAVAGNQNNDMINCIVKDFYFYGIYYTQNTGALVSQNIVERPTRTSLSSFYGIYAGTGCTDMTIERNRVRNQFGGNPTYAGTSYNIYVNSTAAAVGTENRVYNNLISNFNGNSSAYGIYLPSATNIQVYNNTVSIDNTAATAGTIYGLYSTGTTNVDVKNNILSVTQGGTGTKYCIYFSSNTGKTSNYNNLYMGSTGGTANRIGYAGTAQTTFANWQAVNSNAYDQNGVSMDPMFVAPLSGNYTPGNAAFNDMGTPLAAITTDITGAARNATTPDIGAYEFSVAGCTGTPTAGIAYGPSGGACPSAPFTLNDSAFTVGSGITFQWEETPTGLGLWSPITNATMASYTVTGGITAAMDYRLIVTCTNSSQMDTSNVITVNVNSFMQCYCASTATSVADEDIHNVTIGTLNNSSTCSTVAPGPGSVAAMYSNYTTLPATNLYLGQLQPFSLIVGYCGSFAYSNVAGIYIDYNHNGLFTDPGENVFTSTYAAGVIPGGRLISGNFTVPLTADTGNTVMRIVASESSTVSPCGTYSWGETEDYLVNIIMPVGCTGTPNAGVAYGPSMICSGVSFNLNDTASTVASGITYQWEESPAGMGVWSPITNATNTTHTLTAGITAATDYRLVVTCTNSFLMDTSNVFTVTLDSFYKCYCSPLTGVTLHSCCGNYITNVGITTTTLNNSSTTTGPGYYTQYLPNVPSQTGTLTQGVPYTFNTTLAYSGYGADAWVDLNRNGLYESTEYFPFSGTSGSSLTLSQTLIIPYTSDTGLTGLRVRMYYPPAYGAANACQNYGSGYETEDYVVNLMAAPACSGTPNAGVAYGPAATCPGTPLTLMDSAATVGMGITMQWEESPSGMGVWTPITNATTPNYTITGGITAATDYRLVVTCTNSSQMDTSNVFTVTINSFLNCYCSSSAQYTGDEELFNMTISTLNNTTTCASVGPGPGSVQSMYSNYTTLPATPLSLGVTHPFSLTVGYCGSFAYSNVAAIYIDYNHNGLFTDLGENVYISTYGAGTVAAGRVLTGNITVPLTADTGITRMRVIAVEGSLVNPCGTYGWGETEDYYVNISAPVTCSGTPNAGVAYGPSSTCANTAFTLTDTASTLGMGITYQWEDSSSLGTWTPITNATNTSYTVASGISVATSYRLVVTCTNSSQMDTSNVVSLSILPAAQCYCLPGVTNAGASDDITNVTFAGINNTTSYASAPGVNGYNDYTALTPAQVNRGNTSDTLSMSINYGGTEHGAVWADWDQNGVFDTSEFTYMGSGNASPIQLKQAIPVPLTAAIGITRMRVRSKYSAAHANTDACAGYTYGETEDYSVNVGYPLSIALKDISAINMGAKNRVDWNTESEMQGDVFELQRSLDGRVFETIYVTPAKGAASRYSYVDNSPFQGVNYYRLNMKQSNGSNAYSKTVTATVTDKVFAMQAYPNPVSHVLTVAISGAQADDAMVQITDLTGKVLRSVAMHSATATIDMSGIASGVYLVKYVDANRTQTIRVTKQ